MTPDPEKHLLMGTRRGQQPKRSLLALKIYSSPLEKQPQKPLVGDTHLLVEQRLSCSWTPRRDRKGFPNTEPALEKTEQLQIGFNFTLKLF